MKTDYGTATSDEISEGFAIAMEIADKLLKIPNPAVQNMVKELIALIRIQTVSDTDPHQKHK
jgi:hypothetical protein